MTVYKYEERLKNIYKVYGRTWQKTAKLREVLEHTEEKTGNIYYYGNLDMKLDYIAKKNLILKVNWKQTPFEEGTKSDKLSNWFLITEEGILRLVQKFGPKIIKKEDTSIAARLLLRDV
jgi:hypothetical protein